MIPANIRRTRWLVAALALLSAASAHAALSLDGVRIVDTANARVSAPRCVRIEHGRIAAITAAGAPRCVRTSERHAMRDRWLLAGLIDTHAHLTLGPLEFHKQRGRLVMAAPADDAIAQHNAQRLLAFGVTTIRNPGGDLAAAARYRRQRSSGVWLGPQMQSAGPVLHNADTAGLAVAVRDPEQLRAVVADQAAAGADWIKLYTGLSPALLQAGIDAAHAHGLPAVAHLDEIAWPDALAMGLDGIVHLMPLSPDLLTVEQRAAWRGHARPGTYALFEWWEQFNPDGAQADRLIAAFDRHRPAFDATLVAFHAAFVQDQDNVYKQDTARYAHPALRAHWQDWFTFAIGWDADDFRRARAVWPKVQRLARRIYASGARVTIGTDMSNPWISPGISVHREMALLADAGVPIAKVLHAATVTGADSLGLGERIGRVAEGYEADLVVLTANPLAAIEHTQAIDAVISDGRLFTSPQLRELRGER